MSPAHGVVPMKPHCRKCGTPVEPLRRCPKCGRRKWLFFRPPGARY